MRNIKIANVPGKKDDPSYMPVRGHVPVALYKKFKIFCLDRGIDNSEGLEQLLAEYFANEEQSPAVTPQSQVVLQSEPQLADETKEQHLSTSPAQEEEIQSVKAPEARKRRVPPQRIKPHQKK